MLSDLNSQYFIDNCYGDVIKEKTGYACDGHGSVRILTNEAGRITDRYSYDAYGNLLEKEGDTDNDFLYTGEQYNANTGLYYLRARYMNPSTGTFISMDSYQGSIYDPVTLHKYLYANANPVMYTDPSGYKTKLVELVVAVGILGILANSMAFNNQVSLNIFSSMRRNTVDATLEQTCTVSAGDWKNTILDFPAHHFDTRWIVTTVTWMLSWQLFEAIYATEEDTSSIPGVPAKEQDDNTAPSGIPAEVQNGPTIEQSNGKKQSKPDGKKRSTGKPSWAEGEEPEDGENGKQYAKRMMDKKYGKGNWRRKGKQGEEYSKLKKYGDRAQYWKK